MIENFCLLYTEAADIAMFDHITADENNKLKSKINDIQSSVQIYSPTANITVILFICFILLLFSSCGGTEHKGIDI